MEKNKDRDKSRNTVMVNTKPDVDFSRLQELKIKDNQRLFFVSDVHGELDKLNQLLDSVSFSDQDILVCCGDLIDRGSKSLETLEFFLAKDNTFFVQGNHDYMFAQGDLLSSLANGGQWALDISREQRLNLAAKISKRPFAIELSKDGFLIGVTHAAVPVEFENWSDFIVALFHVSNHIEQEVMWERGFVEYNYSKFYNKLVLGVDFTVHGHTVVDEPLWVGNRLHIDTGACWKEEPFGQLTLVEFSKGNFTFYKSK